MVNRPEYCTDEMVSYLDGLMEKARKLQDMGMVFDEIAVEIGKEDKFNKKFPELTSEQCTQILIWWIFR